MTRKEWMAAIVVDVLALWLMYATWVGQDWAGNVLAFVCVGVVFSLIMMIAVAGAEKEASEVHRMFDKYDGKCWKVYDGTTNLILCIALAAIGWVWTAVIIMILSIFKHGAVGLALQKAKGKKVEAEAKADWKHCPVHGPSNPNAAWACPECMREARERLNATFPATQGDSHE